MGSSQNSHKLRTLVAAFDIPISRIATVTGVSRSLVSRILSPHDPLEGGHLFWTCAERSLGRILDARRLGVFQIKPISADELESALKK